MSHVDDNNRIPKIEKDIQIREKKKREAVSTKTRSQKSQKAARYDRHTVTLGVEEIFYMESFV